MFLQFEEVISYNRDTYETPEVSDIYLNVDNIMAVRPFRPNPAWTKIIMHVDGENNYYLVVGSAVNVWARVENKSPTFTDDLLRSRDS